MEAELMSLNRKLLAAGRAKTCKDEYAILKSDEERFSYALGLLEEYEITPKIQTEEKSSALSVDYRKAGNELFVSVNSEKTRDKNLELYTKSIAFAESNSLELALAYGNRSALLYSARLYDHCLLDIDRALALDYPDNLRHKLTTRRVNCLASTVTVPMTNIDETMNVTKRCFEAVNLEDEKKLSESREILKNTADTQLQRKMFDEEKFIPKRPNENLEIPGISPALKIAYNEKFGRHVVATRKIQPGELLGVQNGYATILAPENFYTHCSYCLRQTWSAVPCENCAQAVYCNENCRDEALKDHHDVECRVIGALLRFEFNLLGLMSLRLAIRAVRDAGSFESLKKKLESVESWQDPRTKGFTGTPPILNENDYSSVYTLAKNTEKRSSPDLFGRSFNAVYILYCVGILTDFLGEKFSLDIRSVRNNPWSIFLGGLITRHQQIIPSNVHTVTETKGMLDRERGASMIPFLSLFNHSCDCMVMRIHYGTKIALYALQTIEAGEQVFDNYGMHYSVEPRYSRQQRLKRQFFFNCECRACNEDWPLFGDTPSWKKKGLDRSQKLKLAKALKNFDKYVDLATIGRVEEKLYIIKDLEQMIKLLLDYVDLPCREVNEVVETLKRIYALISTRYQSLCDSVKLY